MKRFLLILFALFLVAGPAGAHYPVFRQRAAVLVTPYVPSVQLLAAAHYCQPAAALQPSYAAPGDPTLAALLAEMRALRAGLAGAEAVPAPQAAPPQAYLPAQPAAIGYQASGYAVAGYHAGFLAAPFALAHHVQAFAAFHGRRIALPPRVAVGRRPVVLPRRGVVPPRALARRAPVRLNVNIGRGALAGARGLGRGFRF